MIDFKDAENVFSVSGGKDSTCTLLLGLEQNIPNAHYVFADTGNEHEDTVEYIAYLQDALGITIRTVRASLAEKVIAKHDLVRGKWVDEGTITPAEAEEICKLLVPTGIPFLDLCMWKGRFPSRRAQFCTQELKVIPIQEQVFRPIIGAGKEAISWQGIRWDESAKRAKDQPWEERASQTGGECGDQFYIYIHRPILNYTAEQTFDVHKRHGIEPNPLYKKGMGRVGCMPCINAKKAELREIAARFPDHIARIAAWEKTVSLVAKRQNSTFFHSRTNPVNATKDNNLITTDSHGIYSIIEWANTQRGGRYFDWMADEVQPNVCSSAYGLCE